MWIVIIYDTVIMHLEALDFCNISASIKLMINIFHMKSFLQYVWMALLFIFLVESSSCPLIVEEYKLTCHFLGENPCTLWLDWLLMLDFHTQHAACISWILFGPVLYIHVCEF